MAIEDLNIGTRIKLALCGNPVVVNVDPYELGTISDRSRVRYECDVMVFNGSSFELAATLKADEEPVELVGDAEVFKGAFFDISSILKAYLSTDNVFDTIINAYAGSIAGIDALVGRYYTIVRKYVDNVLDDTDTNSEAFCYNGAIGEDDYQTYKDTFFTSYIGSTGRFLNSGSLSTTADGFLFLNWINNYADDISTIQLKVVGVYDGGLEVPALIGQAASVKPMGVYCVPVGGDVVMGSGPNKLYPDDLLYYYAYLIDNNGDRVSEVKKVDHDISYHEKTRCLVYLNHVNVPVVLVAAGQNEESVAFQKTEGEAFRGFDYEAHLAETRTDHVDGQRSFVLNLRWRKQSESRDLVNIGYSKKVFLKDKNKFLPLVLTSKSIPVQMDATVWVGISLNFDLAYKETAWSDLPAADVVEERATGWRPFVTACQLDSRGRYNGMREVVTLEKYYIDDNSAVKPASVKPNKYGETGYVPPLADGSCAVANTPYRNAVQTKTGSFSRNNCGEGLVGVPATITVAANSWGSLISLADANAKAVAELNQLDTQAYANANGTCNTVGVYNPGTIPANRWWLRVGGFTGLSGVSANFDTYRPGNMWFQYPEYQPNQTDVALSPRFDVSFPVLSGRNYYFNAYELGGKTLRFWKNGLLQGSTLIVDYNQVVVFPVNPANQDKWWIDVV